PESEALKRAHTVRKETLAAGLGPGMAGLLEKGHPHSAPAQFDRHRRPGRTAADHDGVPGHHPSTSISDAKPGPSATIRPRSPARARPLRRRSSSAKRTEALERLPTRASEPRVHSSSRSLSPKPSR